MSAAAALRSRGAAAARAVLTGAARVINRQQVRSGGGGPPSFVTTPSRWSFDWSKDMFHLYFMVVGGPLMAITTYCNIFIGPGRLQPIPEGYEPRPEEYYRHPISRFFLTSGMMRLPQMQYEIHLFNFWDAEKKTRERMLRSEVRRLMREDGDYKAYYYTPYSARYFRVHRKIDMWEGEHGTRNPD